MTGKFGGIIRKAQEERQNSDEVVSKDSGMPVNQKSGIPESSVDSEADVDFVNLSIRVPRVLRQHWAAEAKRIGTTLTKEITESLEKRFGRPKTPAD